MVSVDVGIWSMESLRAERYRSVASLEGVLEGTPAPTEDGCCCGAPPTDAEEGVGAFGTTALPQDRPDNPTLRTFCCDAWAACAACCCCNICCFATASCCCC